MKVYVNNMLLAGEVKKANTFKSRLIGLLDRKGIEINEGLLLVNCSSVHCFFMKFSIDVVYLSKGMTVLDKETIKPWKTGKRVKGTKNILELKEGAAQNVSTGDILVLKD